MMMTPSTSHGAGAIGASRYWIIGGRFCSTEFREVVPGTECLVGPFEQRDSALREWRKLSEERRSECTVRYSIVAEPWS
jgi:hypothetical protein